MNEPKKEEKHQNLDAHPEMKDMTIVLTIVVTLVLLALAIFR